MCLVGLGNFVPFVLVPVYNEYDVVNEGYIGSNDDDNTVECSVQ